MKTIIHSTVYLNSILTTDVPANPIIGFVYSTGKGFFLRTDCHKDEWQFPVVSDFEKGNAQTSFGDKPTLKEALYANSVITGDIKLFLFDTAQELFNWLSE
jgi:hypothetical protein